MADHVQNEGARDLVSECYCKNMSDKHLISSAVQRIFFLALFPWERWWCKWNTPRGVACCNLWLSLKTRWSTWVKCSSPGFLPNTGNIIFFLFIFFSWSDTCLVGCNYSLGFRMDRWIHHCATFQKVKSFLSFSVVRHNLFGLVIGT